MFLWFISFYTTRRVALWRPATRWKWMDTQDPAQPSSHQGVACLLLEGKSASPRRILSVLWRRCLPLPLLLHLLMLSPTLPSPTPPSLPHLPLEEWKLKGTMWLLNPFPRTASDPWYLLGLLWYQACISFFFFPILWAVLTRSLYWEVSA